jgi:hypothetical protein
VTDLGDLVHEWDRLEVATAGADALVEPVRRNGSVLRAGASEAAIAAAEDRIGSPLPADYREFLTITNGAYADWGGVVLARESSWRRGTTVPGLGLLCAEDLTLMRKAEAQWVELWVGGDHGTEPAFREDYQDVMDYRPLHDAVLISAIADRFCLLLVPTTEGWEVWDFFKEGATRYLSFRNWMGARIRGLSPAASTPAEYQTLLESALAGDTPSRLDLLRVDDPGLERAVLAALEDPDHFGYVVMTAHRWPSDAMVDLLGRLLRGVPSGAISGLSTSMLIKQQLIRIGTERAEAVLREAGAGFEADAVARARSDSGDG